MSSRPADGLSRDCALMRRLESVSGHAIARKLDAAVSLLKTPSEPEFERLRESVLYRSAQVSRNEI